MGSCDTIYLLDFGLLFTDDRSTYLGGGDLTPTSITRVKCYLRTLFPHQISTLLCFYLVPTSKVKDSKMNAILTLYTMPIKHTVKTWHAQSDKRAPQDNYVCEHN